MIVGVLGARIVVFVVVVVVVGLVGPGMIAGLTGVGGVRVMIFGGQTLISRSLL